MPAWLQLTVEAPPEASEGIGDRMSELGALAVTLQDAADEPIYEPAPGSTPLWHATRVVGLFDAEHDVEEVGRTLASEGLCAPGSWRISPLEDKDWDRAWMDRFHPLRFGRRLWIVPSWHDAPDPDAVNVDLDPGLAFGTGTHPTTRLCMEWLDAHPPANRTVVDFGCGSGILAVAAAKLGARRVIAVDNDPQALVATRENVRRNGVEDVVETCFPEHLPTVESDLVLANILANPLIDLAPVLHSIVRPGGGLVLSGILPEQAGDVSSAYAGAFRMAAPAELEGWVRLEGERLD